ncbi:hypothetical protein QEH56_10045 [Pelagicoccus enzymogenes]|uniref:hypothetical protein n=1 Tax=Pelagicoccus enzymogenes TaxID=2773457 RepID=UPI0028101F6D|nr:hypothetical protein [Pelagicoccus enzymogenes]MDQ8198490.1 hypothetical protein [Pelagicoccus enzymogenes]
MKTITATILYTLSLLLAPSCLAEDRIAMFLIEQQGDEIIFLMVTEGEEGAYMIVGLGSSNPPIKLTNEEFGLLRHKFFNMGIAPFESIFPPETDKNYVIVLRSDYRGKNDNGTTFQIPKDSAPERIVEWIELMKDISGINKKESN